MASQESIPRGSLLPLHLEWWAKGKIRWRRYADNRIYQNSIVCTWSSSALGMAQGCHAGIELETISQNIFHIIYFDRFEIRVNSAFRHYDYSFSLSCVSMLSWHEGKANWKGKTYSSDYTAHFLFPTVCRGRALRNKDEINSTTTIRISTGGSKKRYPPDTSHQCQPTTVSTHDLNNECSRVGTGGRADVVHRLTNSMKRCRRTDSKIGHCHIVVD
jgi:hypothetical protein